MTIPFSQTTHSLQADSFRPAAVILVLALLILLAWLGWFFWGGVVLYETSEPTTVNVRTGFVKAVFPAPASERVYIGQTAVFHIEGSVGELLGPLPGEVVGVEFLPGAETLSAEIIVPVTSALLLAAEEEGPLMGRVDVQTETVSPAMLVLRGAGLFTESPPVFFSSG